MMKIGLFTDTYLPNINGVVSSVELLRKKMEEKGHEVYVICTYPGLFDIKQEGRIIRLPGIEIKKLYGYAIAQPVHLLYIEKLKELELDLIHCHTEFGVGIFGQIVSHELHIPMVRTYHTAYEDYTHYINPLDLQQVDYSLKKAVSFLSKVYGDSCVRMISPSHKTAEILKSYGIKTPIEVIPTGIDLSKFEKTEDDLERIKKIREEEYKVKDEKVLLFIGRIAKEKSIDIIIKAFEYVKNENIKMKLVIIGDGPSLKELKDLTSQLDLNDYVLFLGKKENSQIGYYYRSGDGFISASKSETQGMTYIEALASSLLVFGARDEVLFDLIKEGENGYYFDDEEELFEKLKIFNLLDSNVLIEMKNNATSSIKKYDSELFANSIEKLYKEVLNEFLNTCSISKVKLKNDYVVVSFLFQNGDTDDVSISLDDYYGQGLRTNQKISYEKYISLKDKEDEVLAYSACLKRIANKDYTTKQIYDYLNKKYELSSEKANRIVEKLTNLKLLDDYAFALNKFEFYDRAFMSKRRIINKLRSDGIPVEYIEDIVVNDVDNELLKAKHQAQKYQNSIKNKSLQSKKQSIIKKLVSDGFSYDVAKSAIEVLDFTDEIFEEKDLLKKEAYKQKKRLMKKYNGYELRNRIYYALIAKGFVSEQIYAIIDEMEEDYE